MSVFNNQTGLSLVRTGRMQAVASSEIAVIAECQHAAVVDRCVALLAKNSMDNAAALTQYAAHLTEVAPEGQEYYDAITKTYVITAGNRISEIGGFK